MSFWDPKTWIRKPGERHAVFGAGNLGLDLSLRIAAEGGSVDVYTASCGYDLTDATKLMTIVNADPGYDYVWWCVGGYSVESANADPVGAAKILYTAPRVVSKFAHPRSKVFIFSTDYAADEAVPARPDRQNGMPGLDRYTSLKLDMECAIERGSRPLTVVVRVGSLYGNHKPGSTFPGKILARYRDGGIGVKFPVNEVTPTSTEWAADMLFRVRDLLPSENGPLRHHLAPRGNISLNDWAKLILRDKPITFDPQPFYDETRPYTSGLGTSWSRQNPHWHDVWKVYFKPSDYQPQPSPQQRKEPSAAT